MKILFYLHKNGYQGADDIAFPLMCRIHLGKKDGYSQSKRVEFPVKASVKESEWDKVSEKVKKNHTKYLTINRKINEIKLEASQFENKKASSNAIDLYVELKAHFKPEKKAPEKVILTPVEYTQRFIELRKTELSPSSIKTYRSTLLKLENFAGEQNLTLSWHGFNTFFFDDFKRYLHTFKYKNDYVKKILDTLKTMLAHAKKEGYPVNAEFNEYSTKKLKTDTEHIALTLDELRNLKALDLSLNPTLAKTRDYFLFMCLTSLRISDLKQVTSEKIKDDALTFRITKTKDLVSIPLITDAIEILERYQFNLKPFSDQKMNEYIKEVCKLAGGTFLDSENVTVVRGTETETRTYQRYERVTNHTARRTFVTLAITEFGMDAELVSKITGHTDVKMTRLYDKAQKDQIINKAREQLKNYTL